MLPVNYQWHDGANVFRTPRHSALAEDLRIRIAGGEYKVAFEIDESDTTERSGWSVRIQGPTQLIRGLVSLPAGSSGRPQGGDAGRS